jgi:hypothetical protein
MKLIKKGKLPRIWRGSCRKCQAEFEDTEAHVREGKTESCPRERYGFAHRDCPECGAKAGNAVILYPID